MKIELIKTKEPDGEWYKVYVDGFCKSCHGWQWSTEEAARAAAEKVFNNYQRFKCSSVELIKEIEV